MARVKTKTEVATIKLTPHCRQAWEAVAAAEKRSLANMFEIAILDYCNRHRLVVQPVSLVPSPEVQALAGETPIKKQES